MDNYWSGLFQPAAFHLNVFKLNSLDNADGMNMFVVAFVVFGWSLTLVRNAFIVVCELLKSCSVDWMACLCAIDWNCFCLFVAFLCGGGGGKTKSDISRSWDVCRIVC